MIRQMIVANTMQRNSKADIKLPHLERRTTSDLVQNLDWRIGANTMRSVRSQELCETLFLAGSILCTGYGVAIAVGIFLMIAGFFSAIIVISESDGQ